MDAVVSETFKTAQSILGEFPKCPWVRRVFSYLEQPVFKIGDKWTLKQHQWLEAQMLNSNKSSWCRVYVAEPVDAVIVDVDENGWLVLESKEIGFRYKAWPTMIQETR